MAKHSNKTQHRNQQRSDKAIQQQPADFLQINPADIDLSPLNYRKHFSEQDLQSFSAELLIHGMISPVTVRQSPSGRYELVAGERRVRAAKLAGMPTVPAIVKQLSDDEVIEIQLAENIQRENPHPLHEAQSIQLMQQKHKPIDEIAARLGKSKQYIYSRLKLLNLVEPFQEIFLEECLTMQQALEIAALAQDAQQEIFEEGCMDWQTKREFDFDDLEMLIRYCKCDLKNTPFDTKDKKLIPEVGACTNCPSNTATLKSLFPEFAKQAICTNKTCYQQKCDTHMIGELRSILNAHHPVALLTCGQPSVLVEDSIEKVPELAGLPRYDWYAVDTTDTPEEPDPELYTDEEGVLDSESYEEARAEFNHEMEEYQTALQSGKYRTGLLVNGRNFQVKIFSPDTSRSSRTQKSMVTAKQVQEAIKSGTATRDLLAAEIQRIEDREKRALQIDREKVQLAVFEHFNGLVAEAGTGIIPNQFDLVAARLLVLQSLNYSDRRNIEEFFKLEEEDITNEEIYNRLAALTDAEYSFMIRTALAGKADAKFRNNITGYFLYQTAAGAGVDVNRYEEGQQQKAAARQAKLADRIKTLTKKMEKLSQEKTTQQKV